MEETQNASALFDQATPKPSPRQPAPFKTEAAPAPTATSETTASTEAAPSMSFDMKSIPGHEFIIPLLALCFVLGLFLVMIWLFRRLGLVTGLSRGRNKRVGIEEVRQLDSKRRLVLVRRDKTEHLILIGGTNDIVIESGIGQQGFEQTLKSAQAWAKQNNGQAPKKGAAPSGQPNVKMPSQQPAPVGGATKPTAAKPVNGPLGQKATKPAPTPSKGPTT
jgi:flagellar biogenesis protein FliO